MFDKILIANRGEIACRIMRTAKRLGVKTVAVFSDADKNSRFVALADEAINIGPAPSSESYLRYDKILEAANRTGAQAVHPGYGFLSENYKFAQACADAGVVFIGPPVQSIVDMGSKSASKEIMTAAGVPVTPGYHGEDQSLETLIKAADGIGFPVLIKAVMGGGGKGMRTVFNRADLPEAIEGCRREARNSFGDDRVLIERFLVRPRHVELQVFADGRGNCVYLHERDCSVQRRHQKVLEEAPAPFMSAALRAKMGAAAVAAANAVGYRGAGTVEFMLDEDESFFFMEMNTRLQVEHPVTELITGQDLVEWQLLVAAGNPLPLRQDQIPLHGHAIEARIYAENPDNNFLPATGPLAFMQIPPGSTTGGLGAGVGPSGVRVDTGVEEGDEVSIFYDPMIAKLIVWGEDRAQALARLQRALREYKVAGLPNNIDFLHRAASHPGFMAGGVNTSFLTKDGADLLVPPPPAPNSALALAAFFHLEGQRLAGGERSGAWANPAVASFRVGAEGRRTRLSMRDLGARGAKGGAGEEVHVDVAVCKNGGGFSMQVLRGGKPNGAPLSVTGSLAPLANPGSARPLEQRAELAAVIGGRRVTATAVRHGDELYLFTAPTAEETRLLHRLHLPLQSSPSVWAAVGEAEAGGKPQVTSPMPGKVVKVMVKAGDAVVKGQPCVIVEAMKMEHVIRSPSDGTVAAVLFAEGALVGDGQALVRIDEQSGEEVKKAKA